MPYGSAQSYTKPYQDYEMTYFKNKLMGKGEIDSWIKGRIQDEINMKKRREFLQAEALERLGAMGE